MIGTNNDFKNTDRYKLSLIASNETEKSNYFYHHFQTLQLHFDKVEQKKTN